MPNWWQQARYVILPQMRGVIEFYVVVSTITMLSAVFAYVYVIGGGRGGPGTATTVVEFYIFNALIRTSLPGIASAASVLLFLVSAGAYLPAVQGAPPGSSRRGRAMNKLLRPSRARACCSSRRSCALVPTDLHDLDGAEDGRGICVRQARLPRHAGARQFPRRAGRQPVPRGGC